ncbi:Hypothetical predicted protein [Cloeon dipterum]|uniref:Uncharacterized protein n=1 Tax=Cloeon dipterum TaxID=197152 RepID=A0A8S1C555_9INSE|nr:Hypothetical predicted protein [Cloeon dipterum]
MYVKRNTHGVVHRSHKQYFTSKSRFITAKNSESAIVENVRLNSLLSKIEKKRRGTKSCQLGSMSTS